MVGTECKVAINKTYGYITTTPKAAWQNVNIVGAFQDLNVPIAFETDVNTPAITEAVLRGDTSTAYSTIGTGIGVGLVLEFRLVYGLIHPEGAHTKYERLCIDNYFSCCPFRGSCIEDMSNAKSVTDRLNISPNLLHTIPDEHLVWNIQAYYMAQLKI